MTRRDPEPRRLTLTQAAAYGAVCVAKTIGELAAKPTTLKALILDYKQSDAFLDLAPRTKSDYEKVFTFLEPLWGARLAAFKTPDIVQLRNKWRKNRGRRFVNYA